ncbi:MAG: TetR/AcrR family transcriptional regulator [Luminiphilus sp.]
MSPDARRDQILDVAKSLVVAHGLQLFSIKKLAVEAEVSEPLLFHYFSSRTALLQQLLSREFTRLITGLNVSLDGADTLDSVLRVYVSMNYDQCVEESVINLLLSEPDIAEAVEDEVSENRELREKMLISTIAGNLNVSKKKAAMLALMASSASLSAARFAHKYGIDRDDSVEATINFVKAGFEAHRTC